MDSVDAVQNYQSNPIEEQDSKIKVLQESLTKANESVKDKDELIASLEQKQKEEVARWKDKLCCLFLVEMEHIGVVCVLFGGITQSKSGFWWKLDYLLVLVVLSQAVVVLTLL